VGATEWYAGPPCWWGLPGVTGTARIRDLGIGLMGFAVPWAVFVDEDWRFFLNGNYTVHRRPDERYCMEVARTEEGYFVGVSGCPERVWSPHGRYSDHSCPYQYSTSGPARTTPAQLTDADGAYGRLVPDIGEHTRGAAQGYTGPLRCPGPMSAPSDSSPAATTVLLR